jgi:hypothetical protein
MRPITTTNLDHYLLVCQHGKIIKIQLLKTKLPVNYDKHLKNPKFEDFQLFEFQTQDKTLPCQVGDYIPYEREEKFNNSFCRMIKNYGPHIENPYVKLGLSNNDKLQTLFLTYLDSLNPTTLEKAKLILKKSKEDKEIFYRAIYQSFKMYRTNEITLTIAKSLLNLIGVNTQENENPFSVLTKFEESHFNQYLVALLRDSLNTRFSPWRNEPELWKTDMQKLYSAFTIFLEMFESFIQISDDILKIQGMFFTDNSCLNWAEASAMTAWNPLNRFRGRLDSKMIFDEYKKRRAGHV